MTKDKTYTFIDLFAGAGGLSLGLEQAGFTPIFVNEIVPQYCETYKRNHNLADDCYFIGDIKELNSSIDKFKLRFEGIDLVCGGPPCQGFSTANRQRLIDDPRNELYKEFVRFISIVKPRFFIMENVRGMQKRWKEIQEDLASFLNVNDTTYLFSSRLLYAEDFGVPQHRERFVVIGNRLDISYFLHFKSFSCAEINPLLPREAQGRGAASSQLPSIERLYNQPQIS